MKKSKFFGNCPEKSIFFKLPEKIEILQKFALKNRNFCESTWEKNRNFSEICPEKAIFFCCEIAWKIEYFRKFFRKLKFFGNFPWTIEFLFVKLPEKYWNFSQIFIENRNFLPGSTTRDFKPDWRHCLDVKLFIAEQLQVVRPIIWWVYKFPPMR